MLVSSAWRETAREGLDSIQGQTSSLLSQKLPQRAIEFDPGSQLDSSRRSSLSSFGAELLHLTTISTLSIDMRSDSYELSDTNLDILAVLPHLERLHLCESGFLERLSSNRRIGFPFPFRLKSLKLDSTTCPWQSVAMHAAHAPEALVRLTIRAQRVAQYPPSNFSSFFALQSLELEHRPAPNDPPSTIIRLSAFLDDRYPDVWSQILPLFSPSTEPTAIGFDSSPSERLLDYFRCTSSLYPSRRPSNPPPNVSNGFVSTSALPD